jgi:hypothetical protein
METNGNKKAYCFLLANNEPPNNAMAICGAKPKGLPGKTLYNALITTMITNAATICLFNFINTFLFLLNDLTTKIRD